jgi:hypothetical protein
MQGLINQSQSFKIDFPERALLDATFRNVSSWQNRARDMTKRANCTLHSDKLLEQFSREKPSVEKSIIIMENDNLLMDLKKITEEGKEHNFDLPELKALSALVIATEWNLKMLHLLLDCPTIQVTCVYLY